EGKETMETNLKLSKEITGKIDALAARFSISKEDVISKLLDNASDSLFQLEKRYYPCDEQSVVVKLNKIGIIGCESTARGIAKLMAIKGISVILLGEHEIELNTAHRMLESNLDWMISKWELTETEKKLILQHITVTTDSKKLREAEIVFDTLRMPYEKHVHVLNDLGSVLSDNVIIAVDDETCPLSGLSEVISNPERVIGFHLTYPASRRKIVEVMRSRYTSDDTFQRILAVARLMDKEVVNIVESAGAISMRIMIPFINEAVDVWSEGLATAWEIDRVMKLAMNLPMGPLEFADTVGLDILVETMHKLWTVSGKPQYHPHPKLKQLVQRNTLGKKSGRGIQNYNTSEIGEAP
ncbi:hypothetical protein JW979_04040, partial [bacterium]|nr:hypothetical protein [candidate division CSSED10-310 bacterium]